MAQPELTHYWAAKTGAVALVIGTIGLPINHQLGYALLFTATFVILLGEISTNLKRWAAALGIALLITLARWMVAPAPIEEGQNIFVEDATRPETGLASGLPPPVFEYMKAAFDETYPPEQRCDPKVVGCWRHPGMTFPDRAYAFSSDGIFSRPALSRHVRSISLDDPAWWRLGFVNNSDHNWWHSNDGLDRATMHERWFGQAVRWQQTMPWFVVFRFPADFIGNRLCWRGAVLWETSDGQFSNLTAEQFTCRAIEATDVGRHIFGVAIRPSPVLAMRLEPTTKIWLLNGLDAILVIAGVMSVITLLVKLQWRVALLPALLIAATAVSLWLIDPTFFGGMHAHWGGMMG